MSSLPKLLPYFKRYKKKFIFGLFLVALSSVFQVLLPLFVGTAIDRLRSGTTTTGDLALTAAWIIGASLLSGVCFFLVRQNIIVASRLMEYDIRNDFLAHLTKLSARFFQNTPQGEVMAYATNDINAVRNFIGPAIMYSADTIATMAMALVFMLRISPGVTLVILAPLPIMSFLVYLVGKKVHPLFDKVQEHFADLTSRTTESISGVRVVRAYVRESYETSVFDKLSRGYFSKNMHLIKVQGLMMPIIVAFMGFSSVILVLVGGPKVMEHSLTLGELAEIMMYLGMMAWPFIALGFVTNMIQRADASMARLQKILDMKPEIENSPKTDMSIATIEGTIEFNNVSFRYRPELPTAIEQLSLRVPAGSSLAIIGRTGSGKSTLVGLIARLYDVTEGSIAIDGHDIRAIPLEVLRGAIGFVTQESFLFSETIASNVAFGRDALTSEVIGDAVRVADLYDTIAEFPLQFETMLGERGITLSGGQKQRTAIARAIARDPKILILDDSLSAVDTATEERILSQLRRIMRGRTSIIISHRVSTVKDADQIIVLDDGHILEQGSHNQLLELRGSYHDLYRKQLLEEALQQA